MFCPNCGTNVPQGKNACPTCGAVINKPQQTAPQPQQMPQRPVNQPQQMPQRPVNQPQGQGYNPAPQGDGSKKVIIPIAIIGGVVVTLLIVVILILGFGDSNKPYNPPTEPPTIIETVTDPEGVNAKIAKKDTIYFVAPISDDVTSFGYADYFKVSANDGLYIRSLPATNANALTLIPQYAMVSVVGYATNEPHWYYVRYNDYEGFVNSKYLYQPSSANYRITMSDGLNLRTEPSLNSEVILEIPYDEVVQFIRYNGRATWAYVVYGQFYGWVSTPYIEATNRCGKCYVDVGTTEETTEHEEEHTKNSTDLPPGDYFAHVVTMDDGLNIRSGPSLDDDVIAEMPYGAFAIVADYDSSGEWAYVYYGDYSGWASAKYLDYAFGDVYTPVDFEVTMSDGLNVREGDSTSYDIITELPVGTRGKVYTPNYNAGWVYIEADGYLGWVSINGIEIYY